MNEPVLEQSLKTVCAWCGKILKDGPEYPVSDGICDGCRKAVMAEYERIKELSR